MLNTKPLPWSQMKAIQLEGVAKNKRKYVEQLLENQRTYLKENSSSVPGSPSVSTTNIAVIPKMTIPMIRRILPATIASDIVGIQPLAGPVGLVSSLRYTFSGKPQTVYNDAQNMFPAQPTLQEYYGNTPVGWGDAVTGLEPAFDGTWTDQTFGYGDEIFGTGYKQDTGTGGFNYNRLMKRFYSGGFVVGSAVGNPTTLSGYGAPTDNGGGMTNPNSWYGEDLAFNGILDPNATYPSLEGSLGNQVGIQVLRDTVSAITRKLSARWTPEAQQDLKAMNGLDMEDELTTAISNEIMQEIDNEIISDLLALPDASNVAVFDLSAPLPGFSPTFLGDMYANLGPTIQKIANNIAKRTRRGPANWMVAAPQVVSVLQSAAKSVFAPAIQGTFEAPSNNQLSGLLNGQMKVYSYLWFDNDTQATPQGVDPILMGYKGAKEIDAGYVYAPYVPLMSMQPVIDPNTGEMVIGFQTRYGKFIPINHETSLANAGDYYGKIAIKSTILFG